MKNYDLIQARNGTIPQFEGQDGQPKAVTGDHGPYYQLVDVNGNPLFSENNPAHVQLTGRNVEQEYLLDRSIRNTTTSFVDRYVPNGAIGAVVVCQIYGRTGTFGSDNGLRLQVYQSTQENDVSAWGLMTERTTSSNRPQVIYIYPGISHQELVISSGADVKVAGLPVHSMLRVNLSINGTFEEGQGFDCDVYVNWLF